MNDEQVKKFQELFDGTITKVRSVAEYENEPQGIFLTSDGRENAKRFLRRLGHDSRFCDAKNTQESNPKLLLAVLQIISDIQPVLLVQIREQLKNRRRSVSQILPVISQALDAGLIDSDLKLTDRGRLAVASNPKPKLARKVELQEQIEILEHDTEPISAIWDGCQCGNGYNCESHHGEWITPDDERHPEHGLYILVNALNGILLEVQDDETK